MESDNMSSDDHSCENESSRRNSVSGSGTSNSPHGISKTGRKGDPRMHRAVGARLANPKISLFDALVIGGFEYDNDDDANAVDPEQITLAQRKNQLSRRIRLAQKSPGSNLYSNNCSKASSALKSQTTNFPSKLTGIHHFSGNKRLLPDDDLGQSESTLNNSTKVGSIVDSSYHIRARQHPDYHPLMIGIKANAFSALNNSHEKSTPSTHQPGNEIQETNEISVSTHSNNVAYSPSSVAVTSLSQTAASLGMTLEQLALTLRNSNNLSKLIDPGPTVTKQQKQLALSLFQSEIQSTYQRAMLLAGYKPEIAQNEQSPEHLEFVMGAWYMEGERLSPYVADHSLAVRDMIESSRDNGHAHAHNHSHSHSHDHNQHQHQNHTKKNGSKESNGNKAGRHIHRLEGKCGHQPVLHQPIGGKPHIDFVIGDRVECYHNVPPSQDLLWPSNFNCDDLSCPDTCGAIKKTESSSSIPILFGNGNSNDLDTAASSYVGGGDPKIYDRKEINFDTDEWNFDFSTSDSLLGLVKLGDTQQQQQRYDHGTQKSNE